MLTNDSIFAFLKANRGLPFRTMSVFNFLLEAALAGAVLVLLALVIRAFARKALGSRVIYAAWLLVALRLLVPIALPNPLMNELRPTHSIDAAARPVADQFRVRFQDAAGDLAFQMSISDNPIAQAEIGPGYALHEAVLDVAAYTSYGWLGKWYFFAWLAGAGAVGAWLGVRWLFRRKKEGQALFTLREDWPCLLRGLCCAVQWFNPFVWLGAWACKKDEALARQEERSGRLLEGKLSKAFMALACAAVLCSFFTAETRTPAQRLPAAYDHVESRADQVAAILSGNDNRLPSRRPITTEAEALALAEEYIASPLLAWQESPMGSHPDWCAFRTEKGWHVSMLNYAEEGAFLLMDDQGTLLSLKTTALLENETVTLQEAPDDLTDLLNRYAQVYARNFLGTDGAKDVTFHRSSMLRGHEHIWGTGTAGGTPFTIVVNTAYGTVAGFTLGDGYGPMQTQFEAMAHMRAYLQEELGVNTAQARMSLSRVMWDETRQRLLGIISEQTTWLSQAGAAKMAQAQGQRERYALQLVIDPRGEGVEAVEQLLPEDIPQEMTVLDEGVAAQSLTVFDIVKDRYLVQGGSLPAGTAYEVLDNRTSDGLIPTGGAFQLEGLTLVRFTHPVQQSVTVLWAGTPALAASMDQPLPQWHTLTCTVQGKEITLTGTDWADEGTGYYRQPPENAITAQEAVAIALEAICKDQGLEAEAFAVLPIEYGYRYDTDSHFGPSFWRVDVPDPRSSNLGYEIYINAHTGEILDYGAFGNG